MSDEETGEPLPGANVVIDGIWDKNAEMDFQGSLGAASNMNGEFIILRVPPGVYSVTATMMGYISVTGQKVMDWGEIQGTRPVDKSVNPKGFELTGAIGVEDYAIGFAYARRISDKFTIGFKLKKLHESLGNKSYVVDEYTDPKSGEAVQTIKQKKWSLDDWGLDFGTSYNIGWKDLTLGMTMMNFSRNMKYFYEEFQTPMTLRLGLAMDIMEFWSAKSDMLDLILALDALHPNDHTESLHVGTEFVVLKKFAIRGGYKANHGVVSLTFGLGLLFDYGSVEGNIDYAYGTANYFRDINRFSLQFSF